MEGERCLSPVFSSVSTGFHRLEVVMHCVKMRCVMLVACEKLFQVSKKESECYTGKLY